MGMPDRPARYISRRIRRVSARASLVRITPLREGDIQALFDERIDIAGVENGRCKALVTPAQMEQLTRLGLSIELLDAEMLEDRVRWAEAAPPHPPPRPALRPAPRATTPRRNS